MKATIAILATLLAAACTYAQQIETENSGPFTREEAEQLSEVWPQIREAEDFEDIDWQSVGVDFAPGTTEARRLTAMHWDTLRRAERFGDIDWEETTGYRESRLSAFAERDELLDTGPFTRQEAEELSEVWPEIREAARFEDINWDELGLRVPPGDAEARILMAENWDRLRRAERFEDIDWDTMVALGEP